VIRRDLLKATARGETSTQVIGEEHIVCDPLSILSILIAGKVNQILRIHLDIRADFIKSVFTLYFRFVVIWYLVGGLVCTRFSIDARWDPKGRFALPM
jgi:hypothetical protein